MSVQVLVRMTPELRRRLGVEARRRGGVGSIPEVVRLVLDEHLPPAPAKVDVNQLRIEGAQ